VLSIRLWGFEALYAGSYWINLREVGIPVARFTGLAAVAVLLFPLVGTVLRGADFVDDRALIVGISVLIGLVLVDARRQSIADHFRALDGELSTGYRLSLVIFTLAGALSTAFATKGGPGLVIAVTVLFAFFPLFPLQRLLGWGVSRPEAQCDAD